MTIVAGAANVREAVYAAAGLRVTAAINAIRDVKPKKCFQHKNMPGSGKLPGICRLMRLQPILPLWGRLR